LSEVVRRGKPARQSVHGEQQDADFFSQMVESLHTLSAAAASVAAGALENRSRQQPRAVLDVGAGSAVWSLALARQDQQTRVTVIDLPRVVDNVTRRFVAGEAVSDRFMFRPGDERPLVETTPRSVIIGLQTHRRVRLVIRGTLDSFCIVFQPAGLFRLFSLPLRDLTNHDYDAHAVIGRSVSSLHQRPGDCTSIDRRARIADDFLLAALRRVRATIVCRRRRITCCCDRVKSGSASSLTGLASACANLNAGSPNRSVCGQSCTPESRGSKPRWTAGHGRREDLGRTSPTRSAITTRCISSTTSNDSPEKRRPTC
jgi:hypothetical protein